MCEKKIFSLVKNIWTFPVLSKQENKTEWMNERESEWEMRREKIKWTSSNVKSFMMIIRIVPNKFDLNKLGYDFFVFALSLSYIDWPSLCWWLMMATTTTTIITILMNRSSDRMSLCGRRRRRKKSGLIFSLKQKLLYFFVFGPKDFFFNPSFVPVFFLLLSHPL